MSAPKTSYARLRRIRWKREWGWSGGREARFLSALLQRGYWIWTATDRSETLITRHP